MIRKMRTLIIALLMTICMVFPSYAAPAVQTPVGIRIEAEGGQSALKGTAKKYKEPAASQGYVIAYIDELGASLSIIKVPESKTIFIGYASGNGAAEEMSFYINDVHKQNIVFPYTGGWSKYGICTVNVAIPKDATIKFQLDDGDLPINIDYVDFGAKVTTTPVVKTVKPAAPVNYADETTIPDVNKPLVFPASTTKDHTQADIKKLWRASQPTTTKVFLENPSIVAPYSTGKLAPDFIKDGIKMLNFYRYVAGVPNDVEISPALSEQAQYGAVLLSAANVLSHTPAKPAGMTDDFYYKGYQSTKTSNVASAHRSIALSIYSYMDDASIGNLNCVGHRRWLINPQMKYTGFGFTGTYTNIQAFDKSRSPVFQYDTIKWPSDGYFPTNLFQSYYGYPGLSTFQRDYYKNLAGNQPWSVSLNPALYMKPNFEEVTVRVDRSRGGSMWLLNSKTVNKEVGQNYFNVNNENIGSGYCIIFRPGWVESYDPGDVYKVTITGVRDINDNPKTITYETTFFDIDK